MNVPHVIWEGRLDETFFIKVVEALKKFVGRKGKLYWLDVE